MPNSDRFNIFKARLEQLRRRFLPKIIDATHTYTKTQIDKTIAYTVLAHAEIEQFIEDVCETAAIRALDKWNTGKRLGRSTIGLVSFCITKKTIPDKLGLTGKPLLTQRIEDAKVSLTTYVREGNNGINETNLARMLFPVGLLETDIPPGWTDLMNELSKQRGTAAHHTVGKVTRQIHPHTEHERINKIIEGLQVIDNRLVSLTFH